jgi:hypothetical protein
MFSSKECSFGGYVLLIFGEQVASFMILGSKIILSHCCFFGETSLLCVVYDKSFLAINLFLMWNLEVNKWHYKIKSWQSNAKQS